MDVDTTFRNYSSSSPFDFTCASEYSTASHLLELSPEIMAASLWSDSKENSHTTNGSNSLQSMGENLKESSVTAAAPHSPTPPSSAGDINEEKSMAVSASGSTTSGAGTGRESSSPHSGSIGATSTSSVSSSLETSGLEFGTRFFGDSVWSSGSKGSFTELGCFGSTEEERRFLQDSTKGNHLKPPGSASSTWASPFMSDLSPSLSPSNSETNLAHFIGSPNPFSTWGNVSATSTTSANRRSAPSNSSAFSSGSVSPINRKQLSPSAFAASSTNTSATMADTAMNATSGLCCQQHGGSSLHNHYYRHPANSSSATNYQQQHRQHQAYRRSASHPVNGHLHHRHNANNHQQPSSAHTMGTFIDGSTTYNGFYTPPPNDANYCCGWNMDSATTLNGYDQMQDCYHSRSGTGGLNGLDTMKYSMEPQLLDMMRINGWGDDAAKGKSFFGNFGTYDSSRLFNDGLVDPFDQMVPTSMSPLSSRVSSLRTHSSSSDFGTQVYSRKVFVGGLPPDIDEDEITASFRHFGPLIVDWPHKAESKSYFPPKGYAFLLFQDETSVQSLMDASVQEGDKMYFYVSSPTNKDKAVQVRPWRLTDNEFYLDSHSKLDPRLTVFVGGVPRPLRAHELAMLMNQRFGYVAYAGIDVDSELKYPKGAGRITFSNQQSYIAAINARFVQLQNGEIDKRVELKPYVLDDQTCDYCNGMKCSGRSAPLFCSQVGCLAYLCEHCWTPYHASPGKESHRPVTKESSVDRSRPAAMRW
ncbi:hypothetical protein RvY_04926 [Ramazzottius varieornatus]|uniref:RRM domain-containing protein n=1 Tax=Ramazzottius varieornatus TaxID=947166 RepID=A0A1D1V367_RAMVA|nr:hypothetical protein RvY_04926 [Ramazzottius varieornatus]